MRKIHCLNPISKLGTGLLTENYEMTDNLAEAEGILVRSAAEAHHFRYPDGGWSSLQRSFWYLPFLLPLPSVR